LDWPVVGMATAVVIATGAVAYEAVILVGPNSSPVKPPPLASYDSAKRSAQEIPGFATGRTDGPQISFPLIRLIDPDRDSEAPNRPTPLPTSRPEPVKKGPEPQETTKPAAPVVEPKVAKLSTPPLTEQWRVVATANASYFNLGGHIDRFGIVDSLASSHLRDALRSHSKFSQLPPDIKNHILTQNINLPEIAPYRTLLGMDDKYLEQEQAIKFIRIR
jgi:hypothetical protein